MDNLVHLGDANYTGADTIAITVNDLGNTGAGGAMSDGKTVNVNVLAINGAPGFTGGADQTVAEDSRARAVDFPVINNNNTLFAA